MPHDQIAPSKPAEAAASPVPPATAAGTARPQVLITAAEAYPAFERAVLAARSELAMGFRIFDLSTRLRSDEGRAVGRDWFDLLLDAARRGVAIRLTITDFDPVVATPLHAGTWRTIRQLTALREVAPEGAVVETLAHTHPAHLSWSARLALWPRVQTILTERAAEVAALPEGAAARHFADRPGLKAMLYRHGGRPRPVRFVLPHLRPVTHHQKVAVIDGEVLYCGGLDLNERRWDDWEHDQPAEETWHDVQVLIRDPQAARAARAHLDTFVPVTHRDRDPSDGGGRVLRTLSKRAKGHLRLFAPREVLSEIQEAVLDGIVGARDLIHLETQFLRDQRIARTLAQAARARGDLRLFLVLPAAPEDVAFLGNDRADARYGEFLQARCVRRVSRAFGERLFAGAPAQRRAVSQEGRDALNGAPVIYVHAKVCVFDEHAAVISSANLNGRSMRWDTEFGVPLSDPEDVRSLRARLLGHWAAGSEVEGLTDPDRCVAAWRAQAAANVRLAPGAREGLLLPYRVLPAMRFGKDLPGVPEEMV
jgi:phospholipase D1/2